ncbi:trypsin-like peptidase domain-containing protein [bacterium]|nr:trypsin-like peptidase domain-containing protein [bacterium]MBU1983393.1 trypsin-like peptidase domain-containing protein [bacterium]
MWKFLNFFIVGLIAGLLVIYQFNRNRDLERDIESLKAMTHTDIASEQSASQRADSEMAIPSLSPEEFDRRVLLQEEIADHRTNAITRAIARTSDAVVGINVVQVREVRNPWLPSDPLSWMLFDERMWPRTIKRRVENLGSGFLISSDGYIVTNEHVVRNATEVVVTTTSRQRYVTKVVGTDPLLDMALLKIDAQDLPVIPLGNSDESIVGEWVIALGNPYGLFNVNDQPSVSVGVISALGRDFKSEIDGRIYSEMIQTDAAINRGNSGGPLLNAEGVAVGMTTLIFSESGGSVGIGFAIPSNRISAAIDDLLKGGVNRNYWIGIRARDLTWTRARIHGLDQPHGAEVTGVEPGSPAAEAGIHIEDVIVEIAGRPVDSARAAKEILRSTDLRVGDTLIIKIYRKQKVYEVKVTLAPLPPDESEAQR